MLDIPAYFAYTDLDNLGAGVGAINRDRAAFRAVVYAYIPMGKLTPAPLP